MGAKGHQLARAAAGFGWMRGTVALAGRGVTIAVM
jgi:hypothetical protein